MFRNIATKVALFAFDTTTGAAKTGDAANITAYVAKDYGATTVLADTSATEQDATNAKGWYLFDLAQAETNADSLLFTAKSTTSNISIVGREIFTTPNRFSTLVIDSSGLADANAVKVGPTGSGTAQTARDIGASVLLSSGTGTGQLDFTSGVVKSNLAQILGTALTETAGQIAAAFKKFFNIATPASTMDALTLVATATNLTNAPTAGDFTATMKTSIGTAVAASAVASVTGNVGGNITGSVGSVVGAVGSVTGAVGSVTGNVGGNVVGSVASVTARVTANTDQLAGQTVTAAAGVTFPTSVASPTNITAGTITTVTNLTNAPTAGDLTAAMKASVTTAATAATPTAAAVTGAVGSVTGNVGGSVASVVGAVGSVTGLTASDVGAIKAKTDNLPASPAAVSDVPTAAANASATWEEALSGHTTAGTAGKALSDAGSGGTPPTAAAIAGAVWDEGIAGHLGAGSTGEALNGAGASGNPWISVLESTLNAGDLLRITAGVAAGKTLITPAGGGNATVVFRDVSDDADIVTAQMTGSERTGVTVAP